MLKNTLLKLGVMGSLLVTLGSAPALANPVLQWNDLMTRVCAEVNVDPLTESRGFTIAQIAVHDALNAIQSRYQPYRPGLRPASGASADAAVAAAAHGVLMELLPESQRPPVAAEYQKQIAQVMDAAAREAGIEVGRAAAMAILAERKTDGADRKVDYAPGTQPGAYRPTPPQMIPAFMPQWGTITPFTLQSAAQFRPAPPPPIGSEQSRCDLDEVKLVGAEKGSVRNDEQSEIAKFWYENSTQGWNRIARNVAAARSLDVWDSARLLALVNMAMADGFIAGFEAKYHYNYWRPVTAFGSASDTKDWMSFLETPPVPDHPSTHTVLGAAAATVMARYFGCDYVPFEMTSGTPYAGITRKFWSFSEAAHENGASRVLCGIHFASAVKAGYRQGEEVGAWTFDHALGPIESASAGMSSKGAR